MLWAEWSATSSKYQGDSDLARWDGFSGDNTNYKTVFKRAQENGWVNPRKHQLMDSDKVFGNQPQFISPLPLPPPIPSFGWLEINVADVLTNSPKPPQFLIEELLPAEEITLLSAHGGTGKSMLALQAAVCLATSNLFMNKKVMHSRVLFYSGEDKKETIRHRFKQVCRQMQLDPKEVAPHIQFIDATEDPCLYQETGPTAAYYELQARIQSFGASVVIIDNASDTFDGNENSRPQVRAFLRALKKLGTVLLLTHIDKNKAKGESNSEGYSGSTAWHNTARSRLFLTKNKTLELIHQKSNYGKLSEPIHMTFSSDFVLIPWDDNPIDEKEALITILFLIDKFDKRKDFISPKTGSPARAFKKLSIDPFFPNSIYSDAQMFALTEHAEKEGLLAVVEYSDTYRNKNIKYQLTEKALALIPAELTHAIKGIEN